MGADSGMGERGIDIGDVRRIGQGVESFMIGFFYRATFNHRI